jgi:hypothetical protein
MLKLVSRFALVKRIASIILAGISAGLIINFLPPLSTVERAFAAVRVAPTDDAAVSQPLSQRSCKDFDVWFLDPACSRVHAKHAARTKRHVSRL